MAPKTRTRLSPANRIDQLLDVAKQMIVSDGLQSFTIESLARHAAVSSPLVYNYFPSRQALLQALLEREYRVSGSALLAEVVNANSFEEVIRIFIANNFDHHAPGNIVPVLMSQPELAAHIKQLRKQQGKQTANYLRRICRSRRMGRNESTRPGTSDRYGAGVYQIRYGSAERRIIPGSPR